MANTPGQNCDYLDDVQKLVGPSTPAEPLYQNGLRLVQEAKLGARKKNAGDSRACAVRDAVQFCCAISVVDFSDPSGEAAHGDLVRLFFLRQSSFVASPARQCLAG
jgi:hypothetical protein